MPDDSTERRARMLGLQADAEGEQIARSLESRSIRGLFRRQYTFLVSPEMAEAHLGEWSGPVRFKFVEGPDGHIELWMQTPTIGAGDGTESDRN